MIPHFKSYHKAMSYGVEPETETLMVIGGMTELGQMQCSRILYIHFFNPHWTGTRIEYHIVHI